MSLIKDTILEAMPEPLKDAFGDDSTYTHKAGGTQTVKVMEVQLVTDESLYPGTHRGFEVFNADMDSDPVAGDSLTFKGCTFHVVDVQSDFMTSVLVCRK